MRVAIITDNYFVTPKTEEIRSLLANAFADVGLNPVQLRNDFLLPSNEGEKPLLDAVLFWDKDAVLARRLESFGIKVINSAQSIELCDDKGLSALRAAECGIEMPTTVLAPFTYSNIGYTDFAFLDKVTEVIDFPIVVKERHGSFGQQVHLAANFDELKEIVRKIAPIPMLFQQYIECGNSDLRLQVVGEKVVAAVKRMSLNGDFRANATLGGKMINYTPTKEEVELAVRAAKCMGAEIAGVDILPGKKPLLCEVNANAHFKRLMDATGVDVAKCIAEYFAKSI